MLASAIVINRRLTRIALAGTDPSARDRREFHRMGQEKIDAAAESMLAIATQMVVIGPQAGATAFQQWMKNARGLMHMAARPSSAVLNAQAAAMGGSLRGSAAMTSKMADAMADLAHRGLHPIHSRATANAKRLLK